MYDSVYWYAKWENAQLEIERIGKDLDLKRGENDKDKIELEANRLENILKLTSYYYNNYLQAKNDEENNVDSSGGLTYIGRSDYGY